VVTTKWFPQGEGANFEFTNPLQPLQPFRDRTLIVSGLDSLPPEIPGAPQPPHGRASTKFLTNFNPDFGLEAGVSIDQIAAKIAAKDKLLPSLELALESVDSGATCDLLSCVYSGTISWSGPTTPLTMEYNPRAAFERLFGDSTTTDPRARRARMERKGSILDSVLGEISDLRNEVGPSDRGRLSTYLDSVRDVEQRIEKAMLHSPDVPEVSKPAGIPASYDEHAKLMFDLQVLAYQADITSVTTMMLGRELSGKTYPEIGVPDAHHPISHHRNDPLLMEKCAKINRYHTSLVAYFLEKLSKTPDGDGSLLDHSIVMFGYGMSEGNGHIPRNLPIVLAGGGGSLKGGRHIKCPAGTPLANLHVALLDKVGAPVEQFVNSSGRLEL
jgi:hypothetical protein